MSVSVNGYFSIPIGPVIKRWRDNSTRTEKTGLNQSVDCDNDLSCDTLDMAATNKAKTEVIFKISC